MKTQEQKVIDELLNKQCVSRNWALQNFITRLGAIINRLNSSGWEIKGEWDITEKGRDFVYYLKTSPFQKVIYKVADLGIEIQKYEKI